ncbi:MAG: glycerol-3-phosphate 1-O-acyltransferase PlsY [Pseudomonadota bacterium]
MGASADMLVWVLAAMCGYMAGSIPFGLVLTRSAGIDLRTVGSGNIGATNVLRTGRKDLALATLLLDSLKAGLVALAFALVFDAKVGFVAGAAAFFGHCYPVWLGFKGGKGVATYTGLLAFVSWKGLVFAAPIWLGLFAVFRISSLAALAAAIAAPVGAYILGEDIFIVAGLALLSLLVFWTHRSNISRLLRGDEPRFRAAKDAAP